MTKRPRAAQIDHANVVTRVIVGSAGWAETRLGGVWRDVEQAGIGWRYDPATNRCAPPEPPSEET